MSICDTFGSMEMDEMVLIVWMDGDKMDYGVYRCDGRQMNRMENVEIQGDTIQSRSGYGIVKNGNIILLVGGESESE